MSITGEQIFFIVPENRQQWRIPIGSLKADNQEVATNGLACCMSEDFEPSTALSSSNASSGLAQILRV
jgi:hypothetical protein